MQGQLSSSHRTGRSIVERLAHLCRYHIRAALWGSEIHPSAWIERTAYIDRTWPKGIHIGAEAYIGEEATILTHDFSRGIYLHTRIGARSVLGARSIVMPGCSVGDDCVICPGTVVTKDIPPLSIALGNPARWTSRNEDPRSPFS